MANSDRLGARHAGAVQRYHVWPTVQEQTVSQHVWNMIHVYINMFGVPRSQYEWCKLISHDAGELDTGDLPFGSKSDAMRADLKEAESRCVEKIMPELTSALIQCPTNSDRLRFQLREKAADLMEMLAFGAEEVRLGSDHYGIQIVQNVLCELGVLTSRMEYVGFPADATTVLAHVAEVIPEDWKVG